MSDTNSTASTVTPRLQRARLVSKPDGSLAQPPFGLGNRAKHAKIDAQLAGRKLCELPALGQMVRIRIHVRQALCNSAEVILHLPSGRARGAWGSMTL